MIRKIVEGLKNKLGLNFYSKPQKYSVEFHVQVKNRYPQKNKVVVIMPFPKEFDYQKLIGIYSITPSSGELNREFKYQNRYIHWQATLNPNQTAVFKVRFQIFVKPKHVSLNQNFQSETYILSSKDYNSSNYDNFKKTNKIFLKSDKYINGQDERIIKLSNDLVSKKLDLISRINALNSYVVKNLHYGNPIEGLYTLNQTLKKAAVDCGGFDVMLGSLCMAQKIPVRIVSGFWAGYSDNGMHAWLEILLPNGQWLSADPSIEQLLNTGRTKREAKLGFVGSDRIALSVGCNFKLKVGGRTIQLDILQNPKVLGSLGEKSIETTSKFDARRID